ncbi:iron ABC transporter permease [Arthrobacter sp. SW1]|uniref:FecCD family ABC transporter permease n=1 Tax=Arthrobacter sp. SW1 TaxID=1920889 RepID=UPI000877C363|nr:iron ABC transporter permease [Arthrobacter sp. SW1]OFI38632.1 iron ABC transporter permease [Arthrobacter sp. SW1]
MPARGLLLAVALLAAALLASVLIGGLESSLADVWHAVMTPNGSVADVAIRELRWPRTVNGLVVGACLGIAGCLTQAHTRNPIADPGLLGIYSGAALAVVGGSLVGGAAFQAAPLQAVLAFAGALIACALVFAIGSASRHGVTTVTLVLAGAAVTALAGGLVSMIVLSNDSALDTLRFWQLGSIAVRGGMVPAMLPFLLAGLLLAVINVPSLNALALGEETAASLGVDLRRSRTVGIAAIAVLAAVAVTLAGPIAFAGLLVPHLARWLVGLDYRWQLPGSAVLGSAVLLLADTAGRVVARPGELPVGVLLAVMGAPFFIYLARRRRLVSL